MYSISHEIIIQNRVRFWVSAPDPAGGAYDAPPDPLVVRGFLPSAIAASRLRRLQCPQSDVLVSIPQLQYRGCNSHTLPPPNLEALATPLSKLKA